jgi:Protein of unknown function (DUF3189)
LIYIYHDFGGTHTTSLAAAYHLGIIQNRQLEKEEIIQVPFFNKLTKKDAGTLIFHGLDEEENQVFTLGRRSSKLTIKTLHHFCLLLSNRKAIHEKIILSNTSPAVPVIMSIGGFLAHGLGLGPLGTPLLIKGAQQCCGIILDLVNETKKTAAGSDAAVVKIDNKKFQA